MIFSVTMKMIPFILSVLMAISSAVTDTSPEAVAAVTSPAKKPDGFTDVISVPVYSGCEYEIALTGASYVRGFADDGKKLTDRVIKHTGADDHDFSTWVAVKGWSDYRVTVTLDLGRSVSGLDLFFIRTGRVDKKNYAAPASSEVAVSSDGERFSDLGALSTVSDMSDPRILAVYKLRSSAPVEARYVRFTMKCRGGKIFAVNEIGVCATARAFNAAHAFETQTVYDENGVGYSVSGGTASVVDSLGYVPRYADVRAPTPISFEEDGISFEIGAGTDNPVTVISDFISRGACNYSSMPNNIRKIVVHNTATVEEVTDAERYNYRLHTMTEESSWHFTVDENVIYHSLENSSVGWHAGADDNFTSIGIEMCVNGAPSNGKGTFYFTGAAYEKWVNERFRKTVKNTATLVAELLIRYGLTPENVVQHNDCSGKNCPMWMRSDGKGGFTHDGVMWVEFMGYVNEYYSALKNAAAARGGAIKSMVIPDYVTDLTGAVYPVVSISDSAFDRCADTLETIFIPATVEDISPAAFAALAALKEATVSADNRFYRSESNAIYGRDGDAVYDPFAGSDPPPEPKSGSKLAVFNAGRRYYLVIPLRGHTLDEVSAEYGYKLSGFDRRGTPLSGTDPVGTGSRLTVGDSSVFAIVRGDGDGDGLIKTADYAMAKRIVIGTFRASVHSEKALALRDGETVRTVDYAMLKRHVLKSYNVYEY